MAVLKQTAENQMSHAMMPFGGKAGWTLLISLFSAVCLIVLWITPCPVMVEYPRHLARVAVIANMHNPDFDYSENFETNLSLSPYSAFYLATLAFYKIMGMEAAGKAALSLYFIALAFLVWIMGCKGFGATVLLFFPLALSPQYFTASINYLYCMPVFLAAIWDMEGFASRPVILTVLRQGALMVLLLFLHPMGLLTYAVLSGILALSAFRNPYVAKQRFGTAFMAALIFLIWFYFQNPGFAQSNSDSLFFLYMPFRYTLKFVSFLFTGLPQNSLIDAVSLTAWLSIAIIGFNMAWCCRKQLWSQAGLYIIAAVFLFTGVFFLPLRLGNYSMLSLRLLIPACFFAAMVMSRLSFGKKSSIVLVCLAFLILAGNAVRYVSVSKEIAEILPVIENIPENSRVLPLIFDFSSPFLIKGLFFPHLRTYNYYYLRKGGGISPYWGKSKLVPVRLKQKKRLPAPDFFTPENFSWEKHGRYYDFFLLRAPPGAFVDSLMEHARPLGYNGSWFLMQNREMKQELPEKNFE